MKSRLAFLACTLLWSAALAARVVTAGPQQTTASPSTQAPPGAQPPAKPAAKPDAPKKNRFDDVDDDDQKPAAQKPDAPKPDAQKPAAGKSRFALDDDPQETPQVDPNANPYEGTARCVQCHQKQATAYAEGPHARDWDERTPARDLGCETCHGPGRKHDYQPKDKALIQMPARMAPKDATKLCMTCHHRSQHAMWESSTHAARNVTCVNCHSVHSAKSERAHLKGIDVTDTCAKCHAIEAAKINRATHMPLAEGKMDCSSCHDVHGSTNVRLLKTGNTINEACTKCHAEKRGPFLWEHEPVAEKCTTCHDPHGSSNSRMLVTKETMLCQRCHISTRHPATPYDGAALAAGSNRLIVRGCVNCHQTIHGSNHPSGQWFQR